jgi:hypothetical protein
MTTSLCAGQAEAAAPPLIPQAPRRLRGRPSGLKGRCAIAGATGLRPALDPGDLCGPWTAEGAGQATEQPAPAALARRSAQARGHPVDSGARRHEAEATSTGPERISPWPTSRPRGNRASTEPGAVHTCRRNASASPTTDRSSSSTVQYRCPDGNLTGNARILRTPISWPATTTSHEHHTHGEPPHHRQDHPDRATSRNRSRTPRERRSWL